MTAVIINRQAMVFFAFRMFEMHPYRLLQIVLIALSISIYGCKEDSIFTDDFQEPDALDVALEDALISASNGVGKEYYRLATSIDEIPADPNNPLTTAKVELGRMLFFETGLATHPKKESGRFTYSCASCHPAEAGFQSGIPQGISDGGMGFGLNGEGRFANPQYPIGELDVLPIRTPSILNIAYQTNVLWNGKLGGTYENEGTEGSWHPNSPEWWNHLRLEGIETQAIAGQTVHRMDMTGSLFQLNGYGALLREVFGDLSEDTLMGHYYTGLAMAAYERTVLATEAPFQKWIRGEKSALSSQEKKGAILFFTKGECYKCHNGPALANMEFYALGMNDLSGAGTFFTNFPDEVINFGRGGFTNNAEDMYKFKVPQLYNLIQSRFYGHGASFHSVEEVIEYKNKAIAENHEVPASQLAEEFHPLELTKSEISAISAFIEYGLYDRNLQRYVPDHVLSGYCFPNNDHRSAEERGCL